MRNLVCYSPVVVVGGGRVKSQTRQSVTNQVVYLGQRNGRDSGFPNMVQPLQMSKPFT